MTKAKRMYILPHNDTYSIIDSYHTGGIEGNGFIPCDNCNALISRVAVIKSVETGIKSNVGLDCAKTLTSIKDEDIASHLALFKMGESIRKSFLTQFKQTIVCKVTIKEDENRHLAMLYMDTDNNGRTSVRKEFTINYSYHKYIYPQISDLTGIFIRRKRVNETVLDEFINHMDIGMETKPTSYHQRITNIDVANNKVTLRDLYITNKETYSTRPILSVLGDLIYSDYFKELMLEHQL